MTTLEELQQAAQQFDLVSTDRAIAMWIRKYAQADVSDWIEAENSLMRILLNLAIIPPDGLFSADGTSDDVANALSRALGNCDREAPYSTGYLKTLSALAFAAVGNFSCASILARKRLNDPNMGFAEHWMMQVLSSRHLDFAQSSPPPILVNYSRLIEHALANGRQEDFDESAAVLQIACFEALDALASTDKYLLLFWQQIHKRFEELSAARLLKQRNFPNQAYINAILETSSPLFYPSQARTITEQPLFDQKQSVFITLPTSTGKSLLGELALVASLTWDKNEHWLAVYLAPYRALTDQLRERMFGRLRKLGIRCVTRRGGYLSDREALEAGAPTVLIATPESFDALLRQRPELYRNIAACVFDEFHLIEQEERGLRYEGLLGRFLSGAAGDGWPKIVAVSAVVQDVDRVVAALKTDIKNVARSPWRPTTRRLGIVYSTSGSIQYFSPDEIIPGVASSGELAWTGKLTLPHQVIQVPHPDRNWDQYKADIADNVSGVALDQWRRFQLPILVLASSREQTRNTAKLIGGQLPESDDPELLQLAQKIRSRFASLYTLHESLLHGVAYHNASLPSWVKSQLEQFISRRKLRVVVATTTLAEGVDLPFRVVVLGSWKLWLFGKQQPIPTLLFKNIAGRCGRAWEFIEGDTLIVDIPDSDARDIQVRRQNYERLYVSPAPYPLRSSVERMLESNNEVSKTGMQSVLESQFAAHLSVCAPSESIEREFSESLYAATYPPALNFVQSRITAFTNDMLNEPKHRVMQRQSPLQLTEFGNVILRTGLSPRSGVALAYFIESLNPVAEPRAGRPLRQKHGIIWDPIIAASWDHFQNSPDVPEFNGSIRQRIGKRGYPVRIVDFNLVTMAWISGLPVELIALLVFRGTTDERNGIEAWLARGGEGDPSSQFEEDIEQISVFCSQYLAERWGWVLRGATTIAQSLGVADLSAGFAELASRLEYGVKHLATTNLLRRGCPIDRAKLDWLINSFLTSQGLEADLFEDNQFLQWLLAQKDELVGKPYTSMPYATLSLRLDDIDELATFLQNKARDL